MQDTATTSPAAQEWVTVSREDLNTLAGIFAAQSEGLDDIDKLLWELRQAAAVWAGILDVMKDHRFGPEVGVSR